MSLAAADHILQRIQESDPCRMGIATGQSPALVYGLLAKRFAEQTSLRDKIDILQIDEWYGLSKEHPSSCYFNIEKEVIRPWKLKSRQCFLIEGDRNQAAQMIAMQKSLEEKPLDLCILGFGKNGHLAFNEPGSTATSTCRIISLDKVSESHSMVKDVKQAVNKGMTIGLKEIMQSKEILLLITGTEKQEAYQKLINKVGIKESPSNLLYAHENWTCMVDKGSV